MSKGWARRFAVLGVLGALGACSSERQSSARVDAGLAPQDGDTALIRDAGQGGRLVTVEPVGSSITPLPDAGDLGSFATPQNIGWDSARPFQVGSEIAQRVFTGQQADYYRFEAEAGTFYELRTNRSDVSPDNVISVFDAQHHLVAENDTGSLWPGDSIDARLVLRFAHAGTYFVRVEDRVTPDDDFRAPFSLPLAYRLRIRALDGATPGFAQQAGEGTAELHLEHDDSTGNAYVTAFGTLEGEGARFTLAGEAGRALIGQLAPAGIGGDGSSAHGVHLRVEEQDGRVVAAIEQEREQLNFHPPLAARSYQLHLQPGPDSGENAFYAVDLVLLDDNPSERNEAGNDKQESAETLAWRGSIRRRALLLSRLPSRDVDYYRVDAQSGDSLVVGCEGESGGSGVRGLHAEVLDAQRRELGQADETSAANLHLSSLVFGQTGTYYLRLSSSTPSDASASVDPWVRCAVIVGP